METVFNKTFSVNSIKLTSNGEDTTIPSSYFLGVSLENMYNFTNDEVVVPTVPTTGQIWPR